MNAVVLKTPFIDFSELRGRKDYYEGRYVLPHHYDVSSIQIQPYHPWRFRVPAYNRSPIYHNDDNSPDSVVHGELNQNCRHSFLLDLGVVFGFPAADIGAKFQSMFGKSALDILQRNAP